MEQTSDIKKMDKIINEINSYLETSTLTKEYNQRLYYIPHKITDSDNAYITLKQNDNYYRIDIKDTDITKPFEFLSRLMNDLNTIKDLPELTDTELQNTLDNLSKDETLVQYLNRKKAEREVENISNTLNYVLDKITLPARSNKKGFYETEKLDAIKDLISNVDCGFKVIHESKHSLIFGKGSLCVGKESILISSHADIVKGITKVSSELKDGFYHGTYDNLGTNASAVSIMLLEGNNLPDNVYFAFTSEEETGRCLGATDAYKFIHDSTKINPLCVALDVTDEGYYDNKLGSLEGLSANKNTALKIKRSFMDTEGENKSFCVVKMSKKDISPFDKEYINGGITVFDESVHFGKKLKQNAFSFCLPTSGAMHSNSGLDVKEPVFIGYILSLMSFIYEYTNTLSKQNSEDIKDIKDYLITKAKGIHKSYPNYGFSNPNYNPYEFGDLDEDAFDEGHIPFELKEDLACFASCYAPSEYECYITDVDYNYGGIIPEDMAKEVFELVHSPCEEEEEIYE